MIAVVIDVPIPEKCCVCNFRLAGTCEATKEERDISDDVMFNGRPDWCPLEEVKTRQHGHWVFDPDGHDWGLSAWVCSECKTVNNNLPVMDGIDERTVYRFAGSRFCPQCGAMMRRGEKK